MISDALRKAREYESRNAASIQPEERPAFHISPRIGWMNDPNGFSVYKGKYHLFYQYYPYATKWGPMHWGHAVSRDLLHWEYLPAALAPDTPYDNGGCFSGSAITLEDGSQLLMYTGVKHKSGTDAETCDYQTQCIAIGNGIDFEKYEGNPVLDETDLPAGCSVHDFRDPKLFRRDDGSFACVVCTRTEDGSGAVLLYCSSDCLHWEYETMLDRSKNALGRMWECPDLFSLDGRDVILLSPQDMQAEGLKFHSGNVTAALIGTLQDGSFHRESVQVIDYGLEFYAPQTLCAEDGRRIMIAWMQNWDTLIGQPEGARWVGQMSLPRELTIRDGRLLQTPVRELDALRANRVEHKNIAVHEEQSLEGVRGRILDLTLTIRPADGKGFDFFRIAFARDSSHHCSLTYRPDASTLRISRSHAGFRRDIAHERKCLVRNRGGELKLRLVLDRFSAEIFVNDGEQAMTMTFYTPQTADGITFECDGQGIMDIEKYDLRPAN